MRRDGETCAPCATRMHSRRTLAMPRAQTPRRCARRGRSVSHRALREHAWSALMLISTMSMVRLCQACLHTKCIVCASRMVRKAAYGRESRLRREGKEQAAADLAKPPGETAQHKCWWLKPAVKPPGTTATLFNSTFNPYRSTSCVTLLGVRGNPNSDPPCNRRGLTDETV